MQKRRRANCGKMFLAILLAILMVSPWDAVSAMQVSGSPETESERQDTESMPQEREDAPVNVLSRDSGKEDFADNMPTALSGEVTGTEPTAPVTGTCGTNVKWELDASGVLTVSGQGAIADYDSGRSPFLKYSDSIMSVVISEGVTQIGSSAFYGCDSITKVSLPDSVTSIRKDAFANCQNLVEINLPDTVNSIGSEAFGWCYALKSIHIPEGVTSIWDDTFYLCRNLREVTLPESLTEIGSQAFRDCAMSQIHIPAAVKEIGNNAFANCHNLKRVDISDMAAWCRISFHWINDYNLAANPLSNGVDLYLNGELVEELVVPDGITYINGRAFRGCTSIKSAVLSDAVTEVGVRAFEDCKNLERMQIGSGLKKISEYAFSGDSNLVSVSIDGNLDSIGKSAFVGCSNLTEVIGAGSAGDVSDYAFQNCAKLQSSSFLGGVKNTGYGSFSGCVSLTELLIAEGATNVGQNAFRGCSNLKTATLPESLTEIEDSAFWGDNSLVSINIPSSVKKIGAFAFDRCNALERVDITDLTAWCNINCYYNNNNYSSNPLVSGADLYFDGERLTDLVIPDNHIKVSMFRFIGCTSITSVTIPDSVTEVEARAFQDCVNLKTVRGGKNLKSLGERAFYNCKSLERYDIPDSVTEIAPYLFGDCESLAEITIGAGITELPDNAFTKAGLKSVTIPDHVTSVGESVFRDCTSLESVKIGSGLTRVNREMFYGCSSLKNVDLPEKLKSIERETFRSCNSLEHMDLPESLEVIASNVFYGCSGLKELFVPESVTSIGTSVFPSGITLYVYPGSAAETYAKANRITYSLVSGKKTSVNVLSPQGSKISSGYHVEWYREGSGEPISTDRDLYASGEEEYYCKVILEEGLAFTYRQPSSVKAVFGKTVDVALEDLGTVSVSGRVAAEDGNVPEGLSVTVVQTAGAYTKKEELSVDESGAFSFAGANLTTSVRCSANGFYSVTKVPVVSQSSEGVVDLGLISLKAISGSKIALEISRQTAVVSGDTPREYPVRDFEGVTFEVYRGAQETKMEDFSAEYPYLVLNEQVQPGEKIKVRASAEGVGVSEAVVAEAENGSLSAKLVFSEHGAFSVKKITSKKEVILMVFDSEGNFVQRGATGASSYTSASLPDGTYTVVFLERNLLLKSCASLARLRSYGLKDGKDYASKSVRIRSGSISEIASVSVPRLDLTFQSYTVAENTGVSVNRPEVVAGKYVTVRVAYEVDKKYASGSEKVTVELPEGIAVAPGSLSVDGKVTPLTYDSDGNLVVSTGKAKSVVRFYVSAQKEGDYEIHAALSFSSGGQQYAQPVGTGKFSAAAMFLSVSGVTAYKTIHVSGNTRPFADVTVYDGGQAIAGAKADSNGNWLAGGEMKNCYKYSTHRIYAKASMPEGEPVTSKEYDVFYDPAAPEVSKVTMLNNKSKVVFDFLHPTLSRPHYSFLYEHSVFTFQIEFVGELSPESRVILHVHSEMETRALTAAYDSDKKIWVATAKFEPSFLPINVDVEVEEQKAEEYSLSLEDLQEYAAATKEENNSAADLQDVEELDDVFGVYQYGNAVFLYEQGYVYYKPEDIKSVRFGLEQESFRPVALKGGETVYLYSGTNGSNLYITQLIADYQTALRLDNLFEPKFVKAFGKTDCYVGLCTVALDGIAPDQLDKVCETFGNLAGEAKGGAPAQQTQFPGSLKATGSGRGFGDALGNLWNMASDAVRDFSYKNYDASQAFIDAMSRLNTVADLGNAFKEGNFVDDLAMKGVEGGMDFSAQELERMAYEWLQEIDYDSPYFQEAAELMNDYEGRKTTMENLDIVGTSLEFLANLGSLATGGSTKGALDASKTALGVTSKANNLGRKANVSDFAKKAQELADKERNRKKQDDEDENPDDDSNRSDSDWPDGDPGSDFGSGGSSNSCCGCCGCCNCRRYPGGSSTVCIDPSGYVYEAVPSNRLEGVTVKAYYLEDERDAFGEPTGAKVETLWDAENYGQQNPLSTDANGKYAWDVPQGQWLVTYEKDGYTAADSRNVSGAVDGYLPVPPPQVDVNVGMVSQNAPEVAAIYAYQNRVYVRFSQYMEIASVNEKNCSVTMDGKSIGGTVAPCNAQENAEGTAQYADEFVFTPASSLREEIAVQIKNGVNYAGTKMRNDYSGRARVAIEPEKVELPGEVRVNWHAKQEVSIAVLPKESCAGQTVTIESDAPELVSVPKEVKLDKNGAAKFTVNGEMPGMAAIHVSVVNTRLSATAVVSVLQSMGGEKDPSGEKNPPDEKDPTGGKKPSDGKDPTGGENLPETEKPGNGTAKPIKRIVKGALLSQVDQLVLKTKKDTDISDFAFYLLCARQKKATGNAVTITWNKVKGAKSYVVYGSKCGGKYKKLTTTAKTSYTQKKLKKGTYYKYLVVAFDKNKTSLAASKVLHITTKGKKTENIKSISLNAKIKGSKLTLKKKGTMALKAKMNAESKKGKIKTHRKISYESTDKKIATVNGKGKITAKKKGKCDIYIYAQNGMYRKIKVMVK